MLTLVCFTHGLLLPSMVSSLFPIQVFELFWVPVIPKLYLSTGSASDPVACILFFAILCPKLISASSSIPSSAFTPNSYALFHDSVQPLDVCMLSLGPVLKCHSQLCSLCMLSSGPF